MAQETIQAEDLSGAFRALGKVDKGARSEAVLVLRDEAKRVKAIAQTKMRHRPGGGSYPRRKGMIRHFANPRATGVTLAGKTYPWAFGAEWGSGRGWTPIYKGTGVPGGHRVSSQARWRRRVFPVWRGNRFEPRGVTGPGWIIQPTIRKQLPTIEANLIEGLEDVFTKAMRSEGVEARG